MDKSKLTPQELDEVNRKQREYYHRNKHLWQARAKKNAIAIRAWRVRWDAANKDKIAKSKRAHRQKNKERLTLQGRKRDLQRYHGVTVEWVAEQERLQGNRCLICDGPPNGKWPRLHVDHCHKTGAYRGLLCHSCNTGIGLLRDNPDILARARDYILTRSRKAA